jgi:hypothetical protein
MCGSETDPVSSGAKPTDFGVVFLRRTAFFFFAMVGLKHGQSHIGRRL